MNFGKASVDAIDAHLQQPNFSNLAAVTIGRMTGYICSPDMMKAYFPRTVARGLMRVVGLGEMDKLVQQYKGIVNVRQGAVYGTVPFV